MLGLKGEQGETEEDAECDQQRLKDDLITVEGRDDTERERFHERERGQQNEVLSRTAFSACGLR